MAKNTSMSALGDFYDAILATSQDQARKYGEQATPDLVPGAVSDQVAEGLTGVAGALSGTGEAWAQGIADNASKIGGTMLGLGDGFWQRTFTIKNPLGLNSYEKASDKQDEYKDPRLSSTLSFNDGQDVSFGKPTMNIDGEEVSTVVIAPSIDINAQTINKIFLNPNGFADGAVNSYWGAKKQVKALEMLQSLSPDEHKASAQYAANRRSGLSADISAAIATLENKIRQDENVRLQNEGKITKKTRSVANRQYEDALDHAMAVYSGVNDSSGREEFASIYNNKVKSEILSNFNRNIKGTSFANIRNFNDLFLDKNRGMMLSQLEDNSLFDPALGDKALGNMLQSAYMDVLAKYAMDTSLSGDLQDSFRHMWNQVSDDRKFGNLLRATSKAFDPSKNDGRSLMKEGLKSAQERINWNSGGLKSLVSQKDKVKLNALKVAQKGIDATYKYGQRMEQLNSSLMYMKYRWDTMPTINKIFTPASLITGKAWMDFSNWSGGIKGMAPTAIKGDSLGIPSLNAGKNVAGKNLGWNQFLVVNHKANFMQKFSYRAYIFSPGAFVGGLFNGDTFLRMKWLGTGFGEHLGDKSKWKWSARFADRMLNNKLYRGAASTNKRIYNFVTAPWQKAFILGGKFSAGMEWVKDKTYRAALNAMKRSISKAAQKLLGEVLFQAVSATTGFLLTAAKFAWTALDKLSGGALDNMLKSGAKFSMRIIVAMLLGFFALSLGLGSMLFSGTSAGNLAEKLGNGATFAPDPNYHPDLIVTRNDDPPSVDWEFVDAVNCINGVEVTPNKVVEPKFSPQNVHVGSSSNKGIDVSHWNDDPDPIDWPTVRKQGVNFVIMKATEGTYMQDNTFAYNYSKSKASGIKRSAYHFFSPNIDGYSQANYFMNYIYDKSGGDFGDIPVALDVEMTDYLQCAGTTAAQKNVKAFVDQVEKMLGYKPMIYTSSSQWSAVVSNPPGNWGAYPLWIAHWGVSYPSNLPAAWSDWTVWQCSEDTGVAGVSSDSVDKNKWKGSGSGCW